LASRPEEFHLRPLTERCGSLSAHTAPTKQPVGIGAVQWAKRPGLRFRMCSMKQQARALCPFRRLYFRMAQATRVRSKCRRTGANAERLKRP